jgi:hypothetical protein
MAGCKSVEFWVVNQFDIEVGSSRCDDRAAYSGAKWEQPSLFRPLHAGGDAAARHPYHCKLSCCRSFGWKIKAGVG